MSLLFRDELRVMLTPEQVLLVRIRRGLTWRGLKRQVVEKKTILCTADAACEVQGNAAPEGVPQWCAAVHALESALARQTRRRVFATVILSNHFIRYALLPWSDVPASEDEEMAYARHTFRQAYGEAIDGWELRLSPGRIGQPQLACAVDKRLPDALRAVFARAGIRLDAIQPHLMTVYNACRPSLSGRSAWFALLEPGSLCLALLRHGAWASVRTMRMVGDGRVALPLMLEREAYLAESASVTDEVLLWAPWLANAQLPGNARWKFRKLRPQVRRGIALEHHARFAAALSGCA